MFGFFENLIKMLPKLKKRIIITAFMCACNAGLFACLFVWMFLFRLVCCYARLLVENCICNFSHNIRFDMDIKIEITIHFIKTAMPCTWIIMHWDWNWNSYLQQLIECRYSCHNGCVSCICHATLVWAMQQKPLNKKTQMAKTLNLNESRAAWRWRN